MMTSYTFDFCLGVSSYRIIMKWSMVLGASPVSCICSVVSLVVENMLFRHINLQTTVRQ